MWWQVGQVPEATARGDLVRSDTPHEPASYAMGLVVGDMLAVLDALGHEGMTAFLDRWNEHRPSPLDPATRAAFDAVDHR